MKNKVGMILAALLVAAVILSVTAHAVESPQAVMVGGDGGTTISVTDITPREENEEDSGNETKSYTISDYYPVAVQTTEEGGIRLLVKTFLVPEDTAPQGLVEKGLTRRGVTYEATDILRRELPGETEKKTVSKSVTMDAETDKTEDILPLPKPAMDYREDGFSGVLALDKSSVQTKEAGTSSYAYQVKETKEFTGLDRNDPYYIPKTAEKNDITLKLADVEWTPMASGAENSEVPSLFSATALYTGTAWGSKADGYTVTAEYTGEVSRTAEGQVLYSIVYEEVMPEGISFPWRIIGLVVLAIGLGAGAGAGIFFLVKFCRNRKASRTVKDPYADRPKMHRPEMLRAMDRGLGGE